MDARLVRFAVGKKEAFCPWILSVLQRIAAACDLCCWLAGSPAVFHACAAGVDSQRYPERLGFPSVPPACVPVRKRNPLCAPNPLPSSKVAIEPFSLELFTLSEEDKYTLITTTLIARSHSLTHCKLQQFSPTTTSSRTFGTRPALNVADIKYVLVTAEICQKRKCCKTWMDFENQSFFNARARRVCKPLCCAVLWLLSALNQALHLTALLQPALAAVRLLCNCSSAVQVFQMVKVNASLWFYLVLADVVLKGPGYIL